MEPAIILRPVVPGDQPFLLAVYAGTRLEELAMTPWTPGQKAAFCQFQFDAQDTHYRAHYPTSEFQVIEADGIPVGRLYVDRWVRQIRIMDISLLPGHRGRGIGGKLIRELQDEAAASGRSLSIHVERFNRARRLYDRLGFQLKEKGPVYNLMEWSACTEPG